MTLGEPETALWRRVEIPLLVVGCDFRTASSSFRELLITTPQERRCLVEAVRKMDPSAGLMVLETCNRVEWVFSTEDPLWIGELMKAQMEKRWGDRIGETNDGPGVYVYTARKAAEHIFRLVAGMESLAAGETEIAGQFQRALQRAQAEETTSKILNGTGRFAAGMARTSRRIGFRSGHSRGIHALASRFLEEILTPRPGERVVVVAGMGEIGRKTATSIEQTPGFRVMRANRTVDSRRKGIWHPLADLPSLVAGADALVVSTGAAHPVVQMGLLALDQRDRPLVILDLGIPMQVDSQVQSHHMVRYHNVDSLLGVRANGAGPEVLAKLKEEVAKQVDRFRRFCLERHAIRILSRVQEKRLEMIHGTIRKMVDERLKNVLDEHARNVVEGAMKELVRSYSAEVFDSVHAALEEYWSSK